MTETFVVRAPGKLFLLGEYAVLDGAPAIVAAVDRHVEVRLQCRARAGLRILAPGHAEPLEIGDAASSAPRADLRYAVAAIDESKRRLPEIAGSGFDVEIHSQLEDGAARGEKLGLGGSAAVTAGVVAAMHAAAGRHLDACRDEIFATALTAHRAAQSGVGSGADVAASVYGGLLRFEAPPAGRVHSPPTRPEDASSSPGSGAGAGPGGAVGGEWNPRPRVTPLKVPPALELLVAWSGTSARTAPLVERYLSLNGSPQRASFLGRSRDAVEAFLRALETGRLDMRALNAGGEALELLAREVGLPLLTPALEHIVAVARAAGAGAKLSGAGGGDCAIALTHDEATRERVRAAWRDASIPILDLGLQSGGVSVAQD